MKTIEIVKTVDDCTIIEFYSFPNTIGGLKEAVVKFKDIVKEILHTDIVSDDIVYKFLYEGKIIFDTIKISLVGDDKEITV